MVLEEDADGGARSEPVNLEGPRRRVILELPHRSL